MLDHLVAQTQAVHRELKARGFPGLRNRPSYGDADHDGHFAILGQVGTETWFELWLDEWLNEPAFNVCVESSQGDRLQALIAKRPAELTPTACLTDADWNRRAGRLKPEAVDRLQPIVSSGKLVREDYESLSSHFLGAYFPVGQFSAAKAVDIFQLLAGHRDGASPLPIKEQHPKATVREPRRDPAVRAACIAHHGCVCKICSFDFAKTYGAELGADFILIHQLNPDQYGIREVDPIDDLVPICPNCHAMMHRQDPPLEPAVLREKLLAPAGLSVI